jgi:hypothetical protein
MTAALDDFLHGEGAAPGEAGVRIEAEIVSAEKRETVAGAEATVGGSGSQELSTTKPPASSPIPTNDDLTQRAVAKFEAAFAKVDIPSEAQRDDDGRFVIHMMAVENRSRQHVDTSILDSKIRNVLVGSGRCTVQPWNFSSLHSPAWTVLATVIDEHGGLVRVSFKLEREGAAAALLDIVHEERAP